MGSPLRCHRFLWCHQSNHHPSLQKVLQTPHQKLHLKVRLVHDGDVSLCFCLSFPNEYWTKSFTSCEYWTLFCFSVFNFPVNIGHSLSLIANIGHSLSLIANIGLQQ